MTDDTEIINLNNTWCQRAIDLILPIQQIEMGVPITIKDQPDLLDIEFNYIRPGGCFWGAVSGDQLRGTIALMDNGHSAGTIRKMFVQKEFRGKEYGFAQQLLETLIAYSRQRAITDLYLGTRESFKAAQRFYERNGFRRINVEDLPSYFPRMMTDNVFYHLHLED